MKILIATLGTHGDVHPYLGVGRELVRRGHHVTVMVNAHFRDLVEASGLSFVQLGTDGQYRAAIEEPDMWHPLRSNLFLCKFVGIMTEPVFQHIADSGYDLVVQHAFALGARVAEEALGTRVVTALLQPGHLWSAVVPPRKPYDLPIRLMPRPLKRLTFAFLDRRFMDRRLDRPVNGLRRRLGLPPARRLLHHWWLSPRRAIGFWPEWYAPTQPDWPPQLRLCGFPLFDEGEINTLPPGAEEFLSKGPPPIVFAPGTGITNNRAFFTSSIEACRRLGRRALILTRHATQVPSPLPPHAMHLDYAPFSALLPRAAAIVHHGGIGSVAQALRAGVRQLSKPMAYDQFDNAARVERLGCGLTLPDRRYGVESATRRLRRLLEAPGSEKEVARHFAGESAAARACDLILEGG